MDAAAKPTGFSTLNPFFIARDADGLIVFLREVFGGAEHLDARTVDIDGLLLHVELETGGTTLMFGERKPDWPFRVECALQLAPAPPTAMWAFAGVEGIVPCGSARWREDPSQIMTKRY